MILKNNKIVVKTLLTPNFPSCHLYMKIFLLVSGKYMLIAKIYLSSSPHLRRSHAKKMCWITHKKIQQFSQRNSWKEMRTFWCRKEDYIFDKTLSLISNSTTFLWHIKIHSMHIGYDPLVNFIFQLCVLPISDSDSSS